MNQATVQPIGSGIRKNSEFAQLLDGPSEFLRLTYAPPHSCACYILAKLNGMNALAGKRTATNREPSAPAEPAAAGRDKNPRLEIGPAYKDIDAQRPALNSPPASDWPTYRRDAARSGRTAAAVPIDLEMSWQTSIEGRLTPVTVAAGRLLVASVDTHTVHARDAATGEPLWTFTAGARVDSPPTIWNGSVLVVDDPVSKSSRGTLYCVAGRSMFLDGGMRLVRLDATTVFDGLAAADGRLYIATIDGRVLCMAGQP